jgi:iron complex outermembrane receptor protein
LINILTNHLWDLNDQFVLKVGGQLDRRSIFSNDRGDHQDWHAGVYATALLKPLEDLNITTSLRADYDENYDFEVLPQLNISYLFDAVVLRGSVGRSIRAADYTERYVSNNLAMLTPGRSLGNPALLAESSWSEEVGVDVRVNSKWQLKTTGFLRQSSQLIDYVLTNETEIGPIGDLQTGSDYFFAKNITSVKTMGFEIESIFRHRFGVDNSVSLVAGYTQQKTSNEDGIVSVYIANHAKDLLTISTMIEVDRFRFSIGGLYKNRNARLAQSINSQLESDYWLWNLKISADLIEKISLNFQVQNLFNEDYQNILGAPMPHRWLSGTVGWQL